MEQKTDNSRFNVEYFKSLGFTQKQAERLVKSWNFKAPTMDDPEKYEAHLEAGKTAEEERRAKATDSRLAQENQEKSSDKTP